jgi:histidinol-phosphate/aromatic aminotransferase/cobyric acid decarboxylase-like protein
MSDLGTQGGDIRGLSGSVLDLSTCVNPYGPPPSVMKMLRNISPRNVRSHPYGADHRVEELYASTTGQPKNRFTAGQGTSEFIWHLSRTLQEGAVGLPLPAYTEYLRAFPNARRYGSGASSHPIEILDNAMSVNRAVIISNPHNPTGQILPRDDLIEVASRHPASTLIVDESYIDFLAKPSDVTLIGVDLENAAVLRSPSKFYGLAGLRSGVLWSPSNISAIVRENRMNWPVSAVAADALACALGDEKWTNLARTQLAEDSKWLVHELEQSELNIVQGHMHFRLLTGSQRMITKLVEITTQFNVRVRELQPAHGVGLPAVRISAPTRTERGTLSRALAAFMGAAAR